MEERISNNSEILVSVIIPTFNRPLLARRALASALAQSIENIEVIVVDDCSDESLQVSNIIHSIDDKRVKFVSHTSSKGPSASRNTGISMSVGKYIALLDDDDIWFEDKLERQLENLNDMKAGICAFTSQQGKNKRTDIKKVGLNELRKNRDWAICSGLVILKDLVKGIMFDEEIRVGEDMDLLFNVLKTEPICYFDEVLFVVNAGEHQRITNEGKGDQTILEKRLKFIEKNMDSYGKYWGNVNKAMILLRGLSFRGNKLTRIIKIYNRCGVLPTSHVILKKINGKLAALIN